MRYVRYDVYLTLQPLKMDLTEGSETSAIINQTPGNYPKESLLQLLASLCRAVCPPGITVLPLEGFS